MTRRKNPVVVSFLITSIVILLCVPAIVLAALHLDEQGLQSDHSSVASDLPTINQPVSQEPESSAISSEIESSEIESSEVESSEVVSSEEPESSAETSSEPPPPYKHLFPELYGPGFDEENKDAPDKTLYLTFDDGPSQNTPLVLDILDQYNIKATFFVVPNRGQFCMSMLREIADRGHTIAVHSFTHDYHTIYQHVAAYLEDFEKAYDIIYDATGQKPTLFRFPGGSVNSYNEETYLDIIEEMERRGFVYFDWNVSAQDAQNGITAEEIHDYVFSTLGRKTRGVVLMHDSRNRQTTVEALPGIIEELLAKGYSFDRLTNQVPPVQFKR